MNNQEVGYVFAEKFNNENVSYGDGYNVLRGKGYSASFASLVFTQQFYGDPQYGVAQYDGNSDGYKIQWVFTSSLTQSFYVDYPQIPQDEVLLTLYQNYIPTASRDPADPIHYALYIPLNQSTLYFQPTSQNFTYNLTGEYYLLDKTNYNSGTPNTFYISTGSGEIITAPPVTKLLSASFYNGSNNYSGSFNLQVSGSAKQIAFSMTERALITGSILVLRNLKITYPVDISNFEPFAQTQDLHLQTSTGMTNARYNGCKMTSPDFNIDSSDTVDGGPVVTVTPVNPKSPTIGSSVPKNRVPKAEIQKPGFVSGKGNFKIK